MTPSQPPGPNLNFTDGPELLLVLCNFPDSGTADQAATAVVEHRLAACVNVLPEVRSTYRWDGNIVREIEVPTVFKTTADRYPELERFLKKLHPAEVPEIIAIPIRRGLPVYLHWLAESTRAER